MSVRRGQLRARWALAAVAVSLSLGAVGSARATVSAHADRGSGSSVKRGAVGVKMPCVYSSDHISMLDQFGDAIGRSFRCAMVFNDAAPDWSGWERPWFTNRTYADESWATWATARGEHRRLIITQNLFPASEDSARWLALGARGRFERHARTLARNLVHAGLGSSVIRLAHEANGNWYPDSIPGTKAGDARWIRFWRHTVIAMRSVRGAHFQFDWTVNAGYRPIPLTRWYPGNDVVDIIGVDAYDSGVPAPVAFAHRWHFLYHEADGVGAVKAFAAAHGKPLSIPEWGLGPARQPGDGQGGDDPAYVNGIASVVAHDNVAYESYFDSGQEGTQFFNSPRSMRAYRRAFGFDGLAVRASDQLRQAPIPSPSPSLSITGGPANASTVAAGPITYRYAVQSGHTAVCSLDGQKWRACTTARTDVLRGLAPGYHFWDVQVSDAAAHVTIHGRDFVVRRRHRAAPRPPKARR